MSGSDPHAKDPEEQQGVAETQQDLPEGDEEYVEEEDGVAEKVSEEDTDEGEYERTAEDHEGDEEQEQEQEADNQDDEKDQVDEDEEQEQEADNQDDEKDQVDEDEEQKQEADNQDDEKESQVKGKDYDEMDEYAEKGESEEPRGTKRGTTDKFQEGPRKKQKGQNGKAKTSNSSKVETSKPNEAAANGKVGSKHDDPKDPATQGSVDRLPKEGQQVQWKALPGYVDGEVVEILREAKEVNGKSVKASEKDPRIVLKSSKSGKVCVHKPEAVYFDD
ncbi:uncharacterized protein BCR38DRAFT_489811 [Pseudomassariella vexata]|uniref:Hypervirulence associated protein TUDOR domain-containing protein n=1 Tax=Pseudomassariella vexata TaxID=1141098 RepID=A0A1Y2DGJ9_9PEZI|nr:uncharacterized protein BCR38DRAFT_489811 [Pseudomassariella vexata]ORY57815.1 hypothetical protein BCR38DRAFT_489811 [Pseudomassariella vexata]